MVFDELCLSLEESAANRSHISLQWQEIVKVAISKMSKLDSKIHYAFIKVSVLLFNRRRAKRLITVDCTDRRRIERRRLRDFDALRC